MICACATALPAFRAAALSIISPIASKAEATFSAVSPNASP